MDNNSWLIVIGVILIYYFYTQSKTKFTPQWLGNDPDLSVMTDYMADGPSKGMTSRSNLRYGGDSLLQLNYILQGKHKSF